MGVLNREEGLKSYGYKDDDFPTESSELQLETEGDIYRAFLPYSQESPMPEPNASIELKKNRHVKYLLGALDSLPSYWTALDASKPWLCYWIIHSLDLLDHRIPESLAQRAISTLRHVQCETGGFAGGPGQDAHVATTYAAVNTLAIIGTKEAYDVINRATLLEFLLRIKQKDGSFKMMVGGEIDVRGSYCAMSAATITNIRTPELEEGVAEFVGRCQTYEGGLGGYPGVEAHGGYAFCGLAALELLGRTDVLNMNTLVKWSVNRQMSLEGGFQGRTNKLVDGCYSFWMGGVFPIIGKMLESLEQDKEALNFVYDRDALQEYLLIACQSSSGGLRDKPFKPVDYYHTCYCLSGLSLSQHQLSFRHELVDKAPGALSSLLWTENLDKPRVVGSPTNMVEATHPLLNIRLDKVRKAFVHFYGKAAEDVIEEVDIEVVDIEIIHA
ncbi:terpenoid cyclases/protein prenyltransferase alpha-alpha toroid [Dissophora ornata]|nr:terpenoid cyclases/protein prenyltransferase alpha-alpha toroid [Dissophora ornata]